MHIFCMCRIQVFWYRVVSIKSKIMFHQTQFILEISYYTYLLALRTIAIQQFDVPRGRNYFTGLSREKQLLSKGDYKLYLQSSKQSCRRKFYLSSTQNFAMINKLELSEFEFDVAIRITSEVFRVLKRGKSNAAAKSL